MSSEQGRPGGAEQRRFARVPLNLDGLISIGTQAPVPCTVRDFCVGGMFLTADPGAYAKVKPQTPAVLYFALIVAGEKHDYQIALSIARAVPKGIGVSFSDPDENTLSLLSQLAAPEGMPALPQSAADLDRSQEGFAPEFAVLEGPLKTLVAEQVGRICEHFLEQVDEKLFFAARDAGSNVDQTRFLDGQRELRGRQPKVREEVLAKADLGISILGNPLSDREKDPASLGLSDLSLIEKDEFEEFLAVSEMVLELEPEFSEALFQLGRRFSYLANREIDVNAVPIGPGVLCNAISDCLKGLQSERQVILLIYKTLHEVMSKSLGDFYAAVNSLLVEQDVLPVIDPSKPAIRRKPSSAVGFDTDVPDAAGDTQGGRPVDDGLTDLMPGPENYQGRPAPADPQGAAVQAAPPSVPGSGVQTAPPVYPSGGVQAAPPAYPSGGVQAAPPVYPAGAVQAAPPAHPSGAVESAPPGHPTGGVQAAPPNYPSGAVQAAPPTVPGQTVVQPGAVSAALPAGFQAAAQTYDGWIGVQPEYAAPTVQRAYSTAQAQLSLRRELMPDPAAGLSETARERGLYSTAQLLEGLSALQRDYTAGSTAELLDAGSVRQRITDALVNDGAPQKMVDDGALDAIEVVANLFSALMQDTVLAKNAKSQLTRLQPSVHRAALVDSEFFESTDHPVRRVINRVSRLRDGTSDGQQQRSESVGALISRVNQNFDADVGVFEEAATELDGIIKAQEDEFEGKVAEVVASCEQQQQLLEARRNQSLDAADATVDRSDLPEEWGKWLNRSRKLEVGQRVLLNAASARAAAVTLVWKEAQNNLFVFVDDQGNKASTLTLQQVAMNLRRGIMVILDDADLEPALERAMVGVVERFHSQVESEATRDASSGFLLGKFFADEVDLALSDADPDAAPSSALCHISLENLREISDIEGEDVGEAVIKAVAGQLPRLIRGKDVVFGRLDSAVFGVFWRTGGIEAAYKKMQTALEALQATEIPSEKGVAGPDAETRDFAASASDAETDKREIELQFAAGISASGDNLIQAEDLIVAAREACETAREMGPGSIYVSGSETEQRQQMEQMVAYANQALRRDCLTLSAQHVISLVDEDLQPSMYIGVSAFDQNGKPMPAQLFAPALARCANAAEIDAWVFKQTLTWLAGHEEEAEAFALVVIPLRSASIRNEDLPNLIIGEFMETPVPPGRICFALPDHDVVEHILEVGELIATLKEFGCRFVLDEFGSGHENYDYIKSIDVDFVTVKTGFVSDAMKNPKDFAMAKSINELVHFMGKKTIAKQAVGLDLGATMREIGIDFLYDQSDRIQLVPGESAS